MSRNDSPAEERLREAYGQEVARRRDALREGCPDPETILHLAEGRGEESDRLKTLDHVMGCPACLHEFRRLRAIVESRPGEPRRMRPWLAVAASAVLLLGSGYALWGSAPWNRPEAMRGADRDLRLLAPAAGVEFSEVPLFAWTSLPDAYEYVFEILDADERTLLLRSLPDTIIRIEDLGPAERSPALWWVRARLRDGTEVASKIRTLQRAPN